MTPLNAAADGARQFEAWAKSQGCDTKLLVDDGTDTVTVSSIFTAVDQFVASRTYDQLIVYFSGHGILTAPGSEYWLLSAAPRNPSEAVNLKLSETYASNSGIPHVVFVSDACRSSVTGQPLSGVHGNPIFPNLSVGTKRSEIEIFYATSPGDPAYEAPEAESTTRHRGIFTDCLLRIVKAPTRDLVEAVLDGTDQISVIRARKLKPLLEDTVPVEAAAIDVKMRQKPQIDARSDLPMFFAKVDPAMISTPRGAPPAAPPAPTLDSAISALSATRFRSGAPAPSSEDVALADELGLSAEVDMLAGRSGRGHFETRTGFSVYGASSVKAFALRWKGDPSFPDETGSGAQHVRLHGPAEREPSSVVLQFDDGNGTILAVYPGFIGSVSVDNGRVTGVNYIPSEGTSRYDEYAQQAEQLEQMKAFAAVSARNGQFFVEDEKASALADRIRQAKGIDPTMGLYAAYAYAQVREYDDVYSVFTYMKNDEIKLPIPFDVVVLAMQHKADAYLEQNVRIAPFAPMLSQGWALLSPESPLAAPIHQRLRPHMIPSLWLTLDPEGVALARDAVRSGEAK